MIKKIKHCNKAEDMHLDLMANVHSSRKLVQLRVLIYFIPEAKAHDQTNRYIPAHRAKSLVKQTHASKLTGPGFMVKYIHSHPLCQNTWLYNN